MSDISIIEASAGSGKTWTLCEKFLACVMGSDYEQQNCDSKGVTTCAPRHILSTTFTRKAAAELAERVRARLLTKGRKMDAHTLEDGYLGTVHSVCLALLSDFSLEAGLSPTLEPLPEADEKRLFAVSTALVLQAAQPELSTLHRKLGMNANTSYPPPGFAPWEDTVREIIKLARANAIAPENLKVQGEACAASFLQLLPTATGQHADAEQKLRQYMDAALKAIDTSTDKQANTAAAVKCLQNLARKPQLSWPDWRTLMEVKAGKKSDGPVEKVREIAALYETLPQYRQDICAYIHGLFSCAAKGMVAYNDWKKQYGLLDFNDMESLALQLLQNPKARPRLQDRIHQVFVDEFQDTSPLQLALFLKLAEISADSVWVGDAKQAIYGFRGTDPALMQAAVKALPKGAGADTLKNSYRSRPCLVNFTNAFFTAAFAPLGFAPKQVSLHPTRAEPAAIPTGLRCWTTQEDKLTKNEHCARLAQGIARMLTEAHSATPEAKHYVDSTKSEELHGLRPLRAGDVAVLCRSNGNATLMAKALHALGIAADIPKEGLCSCLEVRFVLAAYRHMVDARDDIALLEMLRILEPDGAWLEAALTEGMAHVKQHVALADIIALLDAARLELPSWTPAEALRCVSERLDPLRFTARLGDSAARNANIDMLCALTLEYEDFCRIRQQVATHAGCIAHMESTKAGQAESPQDNAVKVMTYHKAKGLEWPVVICADLDSQPRNMPFGLKMLPPEQFDCHAPLAHRQMHYWPWPYGAKKTPTAHMQSQLTMHPHAVALNAQEQQEHLRLLYVGMTRARDILILWLPNAEAGLWLRSVLPTSHALVLPTATQPNITVGTQSFPVLYEPIREYDGDVPAPPVMPSLPQPPPEGSMEFGPRIYYASTTRLAQPAARAIKSTLPIALKSPLEWTSSLGTAGAHKTGDTVHAWLCVDVPLCMQGVSTEQRTARAKDFCRQWVWTACTPNVLLQMTNNLCQSVKELALQRGLGDITHCHVEWPLLDNAGTYQLHGRLDMLVLCEDGAMVIDHKCLQGSDEPHICAKAAKDYAGQMSAYKRVLRKTGIKHVLTCLHLPLQNTLLLVELEEAEK